MRLTNVYRLWMRTPYTHAVIGVLNGRRQAEEGMAMAGGRSRRFGFSCFGANHRYQSGVCVGRNWYTYHWLCAHRSWAFADRLGWCSTVCQELLRGTR